MSETPTPTPNTSAKPKRSRRTLMIVAGAVVLAGGGGGAYWLKASRAAEPPAAHAEAEAAPEGGIVPLDAFIVNLADPSGSHFLRASVALVVESEEAAKELTEDAVAKTRIRSAILELLAEQKADALVTPAGKVALKKAIAERAGHAAHDMKVADVLFSEFVVQF